MCGIFGAIVLTPSARISMSALEAMAKDNEKRGKDAFGFAYSDGRAVYSWKAPGRPTKLMHTMRTTLKSSPDRVVAVIGHTRYATHGAPKDNCNNHPHPVMNRKGEPVGAMVHNGVVYHHRRIAAAHAIQLSTDCDSELLSRLWSHREQKGLRPPARLADRAKYVAETADSPAAFMFLLPAKFVVTRCGRPLWMCRHRGVLYFSSIAMDFGKGSPAAVEYTPEHASGFVYKDGRWLLASEEHVHRTSRLRDFLDRGITVVVGRSGLASDTVPPSAKPKAAIVSESRKAVVRQEAPVALITAEKPAAKGITRTKKVSRQKNTNTVKEIK